MADLYVEWPGGSQWLRPGAAATVGRDSSCTIVVDDPTVSRHHLDLQFEGSVWVLTDRSSGGTWVAGQRMTRTSIPGDHEFRLGGPEGPPLRCVAGAEQPAPLAAAPLAPAFDEGRTVSVDDRALRLGVGASPDRVFQPGERVLVGRDAGCTVSVDNQLVSRQHLDVQHDGSSWVVTDLDTSRGTFIDGRRITRPTPVEGAFSIWLGEEGAGAELRVVTAGTHRVPRRRLPLVLASLAVVVALGAALLAWRPWAEDPPATTAAGAAPAEAASLPRPADLVPSVPLIGVSCDDPEAGKSGSGTVIGKDLVLTNFHVISVDYEPLAPGEIHCDNEEVTVYSGTDLDRDEDEGLAGEVVAVDPDHDLAVVRVPGLDAPVIDLADSRAAEAGQPIRILGYPGLGSAISLTVTDGIISGVVADGTTYAPRDGNFLPKGEWFKTDATIAHGNSGGAAFDTEGDLIGVPTWGLTEGGTVLAFLRPVHLAEDLIEQAETADAIPPGDERLDDDRMDESIAETYPDLFETPDGTAAGEASLELREIRGTVDDEDFVADPNLPSGVTLLTFVLDAVPAQASSLLECRLSAPDGQSAECDPMPVESETLEATWEGDFPDGDYEIEYYLDGQVAGATFTIGSG